MKIVVVGAGEVGFYIASHLAHENKDVLVIDNNDDALRRVSDNIDVQVLKGSGSSPVVLSEAGIENAEIFLAVTNSDETNLVSCLVADIISPSTKKLARIRDADYDEYHENFKKHAPHIDTVINPEVEVVKTIDRLFDGSLDDLREKAAKIQVSNFMHTLSADECLNENATLDEAIHILIMGHQQSLLVTRNNEIVGILRLTDVFSAVFQSLSVSSDSVREDG